AVFSLTMVIVFENIGTVQGQVSFVKRPEQFGRAFQATSLSSMASGIFGTSPTVASAESTAAMAAGGRTGLTSVTAGIMFIVSVFCIPASKLIPDGGSAPILITVGGLIVLNNRNTDMKDMCERFPALLIVALIPFAYSIADGTAIGFILSPILKVAIGK